MLTKGFRLDSIKYCIGLSPKKSKSFLGYTFL
jgi:hypothetical protein